MLLLITGNKIKVLGFRKCIDSFRFTKLSLCFSFISFVHSNGTHRCNRKDCWKPCILSCGNLCAAQDHDHDVNAEIATIIINQQTHQIKKNIYVISLMIVKVHVMHLVFVTQFINHKNENG